MYDLPAPRFFKMAYRMAAYSGVMQDLAIRRQQAEQEGLGGLYSSPSSHPDRPVVVEATKAATGASEAFRGLIDWE